jgi:hypothetical protein
MDTKVDGASINFPESVSMVPLSTLISLTKKGSGWSEWSEGPRREKTRKSQQNICPKDEILDLDSIMFVIGLVRMLLFFTKS